MNIKLLQNLFFCKSEWYVQGNTSVPMLERNTVVI